LRALQAAVDPILQGMIILDDSGRILHANAHACRTLGYSQPEVAGRSIDCLIAVEPGELCKRLRDDSEPRLAGAGAPVDGLHKDGQSIPLTISVSAVRNGDSGWLVVALADGATPRRFEDRLTGAHTQGLGARRLAEMATWLAAAPPDQVDDCIERSLREIASTLNLDRAAVFQQTQDSTVPAPTHLWGFSPDAGPDWLTPASLTWVVSRLKEGETTWFSSLDEVPDRVDRKTLAGAGCRALAAFPIAPNAPAPDGFGALVIGSSAHNQPWCPSTIEDVRLVSLIIGQALAYRRSQADLRRALEETGSLREAAASEQRGSRQGAAERPSDSSFQSLAARRTVALVELVAPTPATVLLLGETGSGKELVAQSIHDLSPRRQRPMIRVSCAAIPSTLIESELFGRERGAYTGALSRQIGRFEAADRSTLFLDEIGELPAEMQVKLLRVLQERVFERLGSSQSIKVDVRIIAATNRNLEKAVEDKAFREDLYYRLNVFPIVVPPLRERVDDIPALVWAFVDELSKSFGKNIESIGHDVMRRLQDYNWPGNIRELRNAVERAVILSTGPRLDIAIPRAAVPRPSRSNFTLEELETEHIRSILESSNWRVRGPGGAAARLGLKPTTLESRMARLRIKRADGGVRVA
jgi:PAS domain S-box-containing protein